MLETCAESWIEDEWTCELSTKPKLATLQLLKEKGIKAGCLDVASKTLRRRMMMLRGGTAPLMIESGRWRGLPREERRCRECQSGKIEDVPHCIRGHVRTSSSSLQWQEMLWFLAAFVLPLPPAEEKCAGPFPNVANGLGNIL